MLSFGISDSYERTNIDSEGYEDKAYALKCTSSQVAG